MLRLLAGALVRNDSLCEDDNRWICPKLVYTGAKDWFSSPSATRDGVALSNPHDYFKFIIKADSLTDGLASREATKTVRVDNVNDPPVIVGKNVSRFKSQILWPIASDVRITDPDRGVGYYLLRLALNPTITLGAHTCAPHARLRTPNLLSPHLLPGCRPIHVAVQAFSPPRTSKAGTTRTTPISISTMTTSSKAPSAIARRCAT